MERTRIFSPKFETFYQYLLGLFLVLATLSWLGVLPSGLDKLRVVQFLMTIVLLDGIHVIFTAISLFALPEFRNWFNALLRSRRALVVVPVVVTIAVVGYLQLGELTLPILVMSGGLTFALSRMHSLSQVKGLSLLYNKVERTRLSENEKLRQAKVETAERFLFNALIGSVMIDRLLVRVFHVHFSTKIPFICVGLFLGLLLLANSFRYPRVAQSNKRFYLSNCFLIALSVYMPFINLLHKSLHGFEYAFLNIDMAKRSTAVKTPAWIAKVALVLGVQLLILLYAFHFISQKRWLPSALLTPVLLAHYFFDYFHYYIDSLIFRFSDPSVRTILAPVILPPSPNAASRPADAASEKFAA